MGKSKKIKKTAIGRLFELGSLVTKVSTSALGNKTMNAFRDALEKEEFLKKNWASNAVRIAETLGRMKGGAMKIGQMLSLQEGIFPPEVTKILSTLQNSAPPVEFSILHETIKKDLAKNYDQFEYINHEPHASASIGQVHRAKLKTGEEVIIKVQYPHIDEIVAADLKNLKSLIGTLFAMFAKFDFEMIWEEFEERLMEEVDYENELNNIQVMTQNYKEFESILIPKPYPELSSKHVITMEYLPGISQDDVKSYSQETKNKWGYELTQFLYSGMYKHLMIHADPNFANFAFREDGKIIIYDFGCVKKLPQDFMLQHAELINLVIDNKREEIPEHIKKMGVTDSEDQCIERSIIDPFVEELSVLFDKELPYKFNENEELIKKLIKIRSQHGMEVFNFKFNKNLIFIDRTMAGHFANLGKIGSELIICDLLKPYI